jgi:putative SOS response-associated peptidase YedK
MCQRYILTSDLTQLQASLSFSGSVNIVPRHNIRPLQQIPVVQSCGAAHVFAAMRWGIRTSSLPGEFKSEFDARLLAQDPQLLQQRCLIPADGFYEDERRAGGRVQPWLVRLLEDGAFCFAGIWRPDIAGLDGGSGKLFVQIGAGCALLTVPDRDTIAPIATKVPVILAASDYAAWLNPETSPGHLQSLLKPYRESGICWHAVGTEILHTDLDTPSLAEPAQLIAA